MKKLSQTDISEFIFNEYVYDNKDLPDNSSVLKNIGLLVDNRLATRISGGCNLLYSDTFNQFKFICKKMCEWNKDIEKFLDNCDISTNEVVTKRANVNEESLKYDKYVLTDGLYFTRLKSKKSDEFAVLEVSTLKDDSSYLNFSLYFIGRKCFKNREKLLSEYREIDERLGLNIPDRILYSDGRPPKNVMFKSFDSMVFTDKNKYIDYIDNWFESIPKFYEYGIIPKLSILLYGEPGTGKSTFCKALAKHLNISNVTNISPEYFTESEYYRGRHTKDQNSKFITNKMLKSDMQTIYSIDDIDCIGKSRDKDESLENGRITSSLLEFLDNPPSFYIKAKDGKYYQVSIVCATTNYYDRLDDATKRFGRFDLTIPMNRFNVAEAEEMCKVYDLSLKDIYKDKYNKSTTFSPAQIQALCMENIDHQLKSNNRKDEKKNGKKEK